jgi:hypothetical protein
MIRYVKEKSGAGKLSLASYEGQLLFGKALINEALNNMLSPRFASSIGQFV